jgi:hypothetical protein
VLTIPGAVNETGGMKQTYLFTRPALALDPSAKIEFFVVALSEDSARELLKAELRRTTLNIGGYPIPVDISRLWTDVHPVSIGRAGDDEPLGIIGIRSEGLTSRDETG